MNTVINLMSNYLTVTNAQSTYQPISQMINYLTVANAGYYLLKSDAATTYQTISNNEVLSIGKNQFYAYGYGQTVSTIQVIISFPALVLSTKRNKTD